jgi:hypothetical protein
MHGVQGVRGSSPLTSTKIKTMDQVGDKKIIGNPEDISSLKILEINDVYEVGPSETYFEIVVKPLGSSHSGNCKGL